MDIVLFTGRIQKILCKTERWASCNFRHFKDLDNLIVKLNNFMLPLLSIEIGSFRISSHPNVDSRINQ